MKIAKTVMVEGDRIALDALVFDVTGREDMVAAVLDANPGLAAKGPILPVGTLVKIPEATAAEEIEPAQDVTLWSE